MTCRLKQGAAAVNAELELILGRQDGTRAEGAAAKLIVACQAQESLHETIE